MRSLSTFTAALIVALALNLTTFGQAQAADGMIVKKSAFSAGETLDRFTKIAQSKGITIFARVDHAGAAKGVGIDMPANQVLIFGNPKLGSPLIKATGSMGIDLPLKLLAWEDDKGSWVAYNDPKWLAARHGNKVEKVLAKMAGALDNLTNAATMKK